MAWNRPSEDAAGHRVNVDATSSSRHWWYVAGAIVVLGAAVAAWWLWPDTSAPVAEDGDGTAGRRIREVKPAAAPKAEEAKPKDPPGYYNGKKISNSNRPPWMSPYHRVVDYGPIHTNKPSEAATPLYKKVFEDETDQCIASILLVPPGQFMIGDGKGMYDDFDSNFIESLKTPIIVLSTDPDEVKELKRAVNETKAALKMRYDAGESLQKIMEETHRELRELGLYKEEIEHQVDELCEKQMFTEQDVDDCIMAANKMLEERGSAPLTMSKFYRESLVLRAKANALRVKEGREDQDDEE